MGLQAGHDAAGAHRSPPLVTDRPAGYYFPMSPAPPVPRRTRRKDARPGEIVTAALAAFAERGFAATRLGDIAARAGISKGTLYLYFATKEDLFRAAVRRDLLPNLEAMEALAAAHTGPSAALLRAIATRSLALIDSEAAAIPRLVLAEAGNFPTLARFYADEVAARGLRLISGILARGMARGEFRPLDPMALTPVFFAPILSMLLWRGSLGRHAALGLDPQQVIAAHLDVLLRGLAADASPSPLEASPPGASPPKASPPANAGSE